MFDPQAIVSTIDQYIDEVNSVFEIPSATARTLLAHFRWDKEKLLERYYSGDQETLFKEAHVVCPLQRSSPTTEQTNSAASVAPKKDSRPDFKSYLKQGSSSSRYLSASTCEICFNDLSSDSLTGMECGHVFCQECWDEYLKMKILEENTVQHIFCPSMECDILVDDKFVLSIITDVDIRLRYSKLIADGFVQSNRFMKWCPAPDCTNAIKVVYNDGRPVTCLCGFGFCFGCAKLPHEPVKCDWLKKWLKKCEDESETANWISANTKNCPKCDIRIEKNGGCNHMTCKSPHCKAEFCWLCFAPWSEHKSCNSYNEEDENNVRDAKSKLERYLFYYNRYNNHIQSAKFENQLRDKVKDMKEAMKQHDPMSIIQFKYLEKAVDVLSLCRNTLKYTYVFAFYLQKNNQSIIFEDNQRDLENATELLSGCLEREITADEFKEIKRKYRYCKQRRIVLLDHVFQGYEEEYWEYQE